jgi:hypothetical protein
LTVPMAAVALVTLMMVPPLGAAGTLTCSSLGDTNVTLEAAIAWNLTVELALNPLPSIVICVPAGPLVGPKPVIDSVGVNWLVLVALPCATLTDTVAGTAPFGTTARSCVPDRIVTLGDASAPKLTLTPGTKPVPLIVTVLPVIPEEGVNDPIGGGPYAYRSPVEVTLLQPYVLTVTFVVPALCAGAVARNSVAETRLTLFAGMPPKLTVAPDPKFAPLIITDVPPAVDPAFGLTPVIVGGVGVRLFTTTPYVVLAPVAKLL